MLDSNPVTSVRNFVTLAAKFLRRHVLAALRDLARDLSPCVGVTTVDSGVRQLPRNGE